MQALTRLVAMILVLTLGGGAQACIASCATPAQTAKPATCHRCEKPKDKSPQAPCQRCQLAAQDRTPADNGQLTVPTPSLTFAFSPIEQPLPIRLSITTPHAITRGPPGDLFHQFCLLLI
jgi:hypothetical protein